MHFYKIVDMTSVISYGPLYSMIFSIETLNTENIECRYY